MKSGQNSVSHRQTWISLIILLTLVSIAVTMVTVQFRFNPAVIQSTGAAVSPTGAGKATAPPAVDSLLELPPGIRPLTPAETFPPDRMSDKINGKAELYLSAGCKGLRSQRYTDSPSPAAERWMEIFIFDMGSHENAFAVYSSQRRDDAQPLDLTPDGYRTQNALFFIHGSFYVEFIASEATPEALRAMEKMSAGFIGATAVQAAAVQEPELFPADGLVRDSIRLIPDDAFGFDRLDRVYAATYSVNESDMTAFLSNRSSTQAATELAAAYRDFLVQFGGTDLTTQSNIDIPGASVIEILGTIEIIFTRGNYLAGVHEAADLSSAAAVARALQHRLEEDRIAR